MVVLGLAIEYLPQIGNAIEWMFGITLATIKVHTDLLSQLGGFLVIAGVAGELAVSIRASRVETDLRGETNEVIVNAEARAAEALKAAAEANLARVKLEQRMSPRTLFGPGHEELKNALASRTGTTVDIVLFDHHVQEAVLFVTQLFSVFRSAGWKLRVWKSRKAVVRIAGPPTLIVVAKGHETEFSEFSANLARAFTALQVECAYTLGGFGLEPKAEFEPGDFDLNLEEPRQFMGTRKLSPFRIQVGQMQLVSFPPANVTKLVSGNPRLPQ
jgi:hypothetical protein